MVNKTLARSLTLALVTAGPTLAVAVGATMLEFADAAHAVETPAAHHITVKNFMFSPTTLSVKTGATVTWVNEDNEPHTIVSDAGLFRSGAIDTKETFAYTFDKPGTYHFICSIHPYMTGTIVVE
jgi:plastocyanin